MTGRQYCRDDDLLHLKLHTLGCYLDLIRSTSPQAGGPSDDLPESAHASFLISNRMIEYLSFKLALEPLQQQKQPDCMWFLLNDPVIRLCIRLFTFLLGPHDT